MRPVRYGSGPAQKSTRYNYTANKKVYKEIVE